METLQALTANWKQWLDFWESGQKMYVEQDRTFPWQQNPHCSHKLSGMLTLSEGGGSQRRNNTQSALKTQTIHLFLSAALTGKVWSGM